MTVRKESERTENLWERSQRFGNCYGTIFFFFLIFLDFSLFPSIIVNFLSHSQKKIQKIKMRNLISKLIRKIFHHHASIHHVLIFLFLLLTRGNQSTDRTRKESPNPGFLLLWDYYVIHYINSPTIYPLCGLCF